MLFILWGGFLLLGYFGKVSLLVGQCWSLTAAACTMGHSECLEKSGLSRPADSGLQSLEFAVQPL